MTLVRAWRSGNNVAHVSLNLTKHLVWKEESNKDVAAVDACTIRRAEDPGNIREVTCARDRTTPQPKIAVTHWQSRRDGA